MTRRTWIWPAAALLLGSAVEAAPVRVVTTTPTLAAIAREVGGERVQAEAICAPEQDPHAISARPGDMLSLRKADLFVQVGLELEVGWAPLLQQGSRNRAVQPGSPGFVDASVHVTPLEVPVALTRAEGDVHPGGNPHYWLDPANAEPIARAIVEGLERVDPSGAAAYRSRLEAFSERAREATAAWTARLEAAKGARVVSYHRSWPYLERRFELDCVGQLEPKPGIPPSPRHLAELQEEMTRLEVPLVIRSPYEPAKPTERLAERTGAQALVLPTEPGAAGAGDSWQDLFEAIVQRLEDALAAGGPQG